VAEPGAEFLQDVRRQGRRPGNEQAQEAADFAGLVRRKIEQADIDGGNTEEQGGAEIEEGGCCLAMIEAFQQAQAAAGGQPAVQTVAQAVYVEQGEREQKPVGGSDLPAGQQVDGVGCEVVMSENGAFGCTRGAGGINDACRGVAVERGLRALSGQRGGLRSEFGGTPDG